LHKLASQGHYAKLHLKVNKILNDEEISQLSAFIDNHQPFPFPKFSLQVNQDLLDNPNFQLILKKFNKTAISSVELSFTDEEIADSFLNILDTAEYLAEEPVIAATYHDDLLLFSGLINSRSEETYYRARFSNPEKKPMPPKNMEIVANLEKLRHYLLLAATKTDNGVVYKVNPDSIFGNGIQQLLYAYKNKKCGRTDFVIEPQNRTIISSDSVLPVRLTLSSIQRSLAVNLLSKLELRLKSVRNVNEVLKC
jgi:hypothetical protein